LQTEDSQKNDLRSLFDKASAAKMLVEGFVVPNIILTYMGNFQNPELAYFTLSFVTNANKLYTIDMQSYFMIPSLNVQVKGPFNLTLNGTAKALDASTTSKIARNRPALNFVIGTMVADYQNQGANANFTENVLAFAQGDSINGFITTRLNLGGINLNENISTNIMNSKIMGAVMSKLKDAKDAL
jgi:hypothetical protein